MKNKLILITLAILLLIGIPTVSATIDEIRFIAKQNFPINITEQCFNNGTYCLATAKCNLTVMDNLQNLLVNNQQMSNLGYLHSYNFNYTNTTGVYESNVMCLDATQNGFDTFYFKVTYNGKEEATDFVKVFFFVGFILLLAIAMLALINLIKHFITQDVDLKDLAYMYILYFAMLSMKYFNLEYMGSSLIDTFSDLFINYGSMAYVFLPTALFIWSYIKRVLREAQ